MKNPNDKSQEKVQENTSPSFEITGKCTFQGEDPKVSQFPHQCVIDGDMAKAIDGLPGDVKPFILYTVFYTLKIQAQAKMRGLKIQALKDKKEYGVKDAQRFSLAYRLQIGVNADPVKKKENAKRDIKKSAALLTEEEMKELGYVRVG